jgi:hypothetical protein
METVNIKWCVEYHFVKDTLQPVLFIINDFDSVLNVIRVIHFEDEVFRISIWQRRDAK